MKVWREEDFEFFKCATNNKTGEKTYIGKLKGHQQLNLIVQNGDVMVHGGDTLKKFVLDGDYRIKEASWDEVNL